MNLKLLLLAVFLCTEAASAESTNFTYSRDLSSISSALSVDYRVILSIPQQINTLMIPEDFNREQVSPIPGQILVPAQCQVMRRSINSRTISITHDSPQSGLAVVFKRLSLQCNYKVLTEGCYTSYELNPHACPAGYAVHGIEVNNGKTLELVSEFDYCKNPESGESVLEQKFDPPFELDHANFSIEGWMYFDPSHETIFGRAIHFLNEDGEWEKRTDLECDDHAYNQHMTRAYRESYEECFGVNISYAVQPVPYHTIEYLPASTKDNVVCVPAKQPKAFIGQR